jgi:hypothetical protein
MTFSIRTTIRALAAPEHRISCPQRIWRRVIEELNRRGEGSHEAGVFLLGVERRGRLEVKDMVFYDELDPSAYDTGVCVLHGDAFAILWALCRERDLTVVADAHTHGGAALQSHADRTNPMVARAGHVAIIVPHLARPPVKHPALGVYEYCGEHKWTNRSGTSSKRFFYVGLWS